MILEVIRHSDWGFLDVNKRVKNELRSWYIKQLKALADLEPENDLLLGRTGGIIDAFSGLDEALVYVNNALDVQLKV